MSAGERFLMWIGILIVINIILFAVDAPFFLY